MSELWRLISYCRAPSSRHCPDTCHGMGAKVIFEKDTEMLEDYGKAFGTHAYGRAVGSANMRSFVQEHDRMSEPNRPVVHFFSLSRGSTLVTALNGDPRAGEKKYTSLDRSHVMDCPWIRVTVQTCGPILRSEGNNRDFYRINPQSYAVPKTTSFLSLTIWHSINDWGIRYKNLIISYLLYPQCGELIHVFFLKRVHHMMWYKRLMTSRKYTKDYLGHSFSY